MTSLLQTIRRAPPTISVGMFTADLLNLGSEIATLESSGARLVHFDGRAPAENARAMLEAVAAARAG